ncbi:MAG: hypothetical protein ACI9UJ_000651, partial [bacterium]
YVFHNVQCKQQSSPNLQKIVYAKHDLGHYVLQRLQLKPNWKLKS